MNTDAKKTAFADVARGVLVAVAFASFAVGIFQASEPAVAEVAPASEESEYILKIETEIADVVIDVAGLSGLLSNTRQSEDCNEPAIL